MKTQGSRWNDVVRAYEDSLDLLEAARSEYEDAVVKTLDELEEATEKRLTKITLPEGITRGELKRTKDKGFAQKWLHSSLSAEGVEWVIVHAWVAAPYHGPSATLRVGVEAKQNEELLTWDRLWLEREIARVKTDLSPCDLGSLSTDERWTDDWAWMTGFDLTSPTGTTLAADMFARSVKAGAALAARLADEAEPVRMAFLALRGLRRKIEKKPLIKGQKLEPLKKDLGAWDRTSYFTVTLPENGASMWLAIDVREGTLLYAYEVKNEKRPGLAPQLGKRLGVKPAQRDGYPCGILLDRSALAIMGATDIAARAEEALHAFVELTSKKK